MRMGVLKIEVDASQMDNMMGHKEFIQACEEMEKSGNKKNVRFVNTMKLVLTKAAEEAIKLEAVLDDLRKTTLAEYTVIHDKQAKILIDVLEPYLPAKTLKFLYTELLSVAGAADHMVKDTLKQPK